MAPPLAHSYGREKKGKKNIVPNSPAAAARIFPLPVQVEIDPGYFILPSSLKVWLLLWPIAMGERKKKKNCALILLLLLPEFSLCQFR